MTSLDSVPRARDWQ